MNQIVLSLFPGADLLGKAFEAEGFCVVRGPDVLLGGDIHEFHVPPDRFDGIIGGPPCQPFSTASRMNGTAAVNLIPEYLRIIEEAQPRWAVMENVWGARHAAPDWPHVRICDADVGGYTKRVRAFWFYGLPPVPPPSPDPVARRRAAYSVMASSWKVRTGRNGGTKHVHQRLTPEEAAGLQGFPYLDERIMEHHPGGGGRIFAIHLLGNGVPRAMGRYIARHVKAVTQGDHMASWAQTGLPLFANVEAA